MQYKENTMPICTAKFLKDFKSYFSEGEWGEHGHPCPLP